MRVRWPSLLVPVVLGGCASISKERGHAEVAQLVQERAGFKTQWDQGTPADEQVGRQVNALLQAGLTRHGAIEIALVNNPTLQATYEELGVAQADLVEAGLLPNPTLQGSIGFPVLEGGLEYEGSLVQSFLGIFVLPLRKKVAKEQFTVDMLRVAHQALEAVASVRKSMARVQAQVQLVELRRLALSAESASAELAERRFKAGNISELEVAMEQAAFQQARLELAEAELGLTQRREEINRLLGLWGAQTDWKLAEKLPDIPDKELPLEHVEARAIRQRLDVDAARKQALLMQNAVGLAKSTRFLGLLEVGVHVHQDADGPRLFGPTLSIELPIFNQRQPLIARLESQRSQAERKLRALSINARSEVRLALAQLLTVRERVEHYRQVLLPLREKVIAQAQLQYNGMQIGLPQLLDVKKKQLEGYAEYLGTVREYWETRAELEQLMGGSIGPITQQQVGER
ncbi:MAG: TolC family protein [Myxococcaceae bacterium]